MQRFSSVSFSRFEFEIAWAALAQASRLAGSGCMIRHCLPPACEVVPSSGVLKGFGRRLHRSLTVWIGKKGGFKAHRKHWVDKRRRRRKEGEGRREEVGGRREKHGGGSISDRTKRVLPFQPFAFSSVDNRVGSVG